MNIGWRYGAALAASLWLAACGGGGGGGGAAVSTAAIEAPRSTALAGTTAPAGMDFSGFARTGALRSTDLPIEAARFPDPSRTYVSFWTTNAAGERRQLAFMRLQALRALDSRGGLQLDLPRDVALVSWEVYDRNGASTALAGELRP